MRFVLFVAGTLLLTGTITWLTYRSARLLREMEVPFNLMLAPLENAFRLFLIVFCLGLGRLSGLPPDQLGWVVSSPLAEVSIGLVFGLSVQSLLHPVTRWAVDRFGEEIYSPMVIRNILPANNREWVLVPLALLPAALVEELLFRSLLLGGLSVVWPPLLLALLGALLFGVMHVPQKLLGVLMTGVVGFLLSLLFLWRWTLLSVFVAHYTINVLQLLWASRQREWLERYG
jgi:hypothetical protein